MSFGASERAAEDEKAAAAGDGGQPGSSQLAATCSRRQKWHDTGQLANGMRLLSRMGCVCYRKLAAAAAASFRPSWPERRSALLGPAPRKPLGGEQYSASSAQDAGRTPPGDGGQRGARWAGKCGDIPIMRTNCAPVLSGAAQWAGPLLRGATEKCAQINHLFASLWSAPAPALPFSFLSRRVPARRPVSSRRRGPKRALRSAVSARAEPRRMINSISARRAERQRDARRGQGRKSIQGPATRRAACAHCVGRLMTAREGRARRLIFNCSPMFPRRLSSPARRPVGTGRQRQMSSCEHASRLFCAFNWALLNNNESRQAAVAK